MKFIILSVVGLALFGLVAALQPQIKSCEFNDGCKMLDLADVTPLHDKTCKDASFDYPLNGMKKSIRQIIDQYAPRFVCEFENRLNGHHAKLSTLLSVTD